MGLKLATSPLGFEAKKNGDLAAQNAYFGQIAGMVSWVPGSITVRGSDGSSGLIGDVKQEQSAWFLMVFFERLEYGMIGG